MTSLLKMIDLDHAGAPLVDGDLTTTNDVNLTTDPDDTEELTMSGRITTWRQNLSNWLLLPTAMISGPSAASNKP